MNAYMEIIKNLLEGKKVNKTIIERLKSNEEELWKEIIATVENETIQISFSPVLIDITETNAKRQWEFLKAYLHRINSNIRNYGTNPLLDLSSFCDYLRFKRKALKTKWTVEMDSLPVALECLTLTLNYFERLTIMEREGFLQPGDLLDEIRIFFKHLYKNISNEIKSLENKAKTLNLL